MRQRRRAQRPLVRRRPPSLETLESRETISDTILGPGVLASALLLRESLAALASPFAAPETQRVVTADAPSNAGSAEVVLRLTLGGLPLAPAQTEGSGSQGPTATAPPVLANLDPVLFPTLGQELANLLNAGFGTPPSPGAADGAGATAGLGAGPGFGNGGNATFGGGADAAPPLDTANRAASGFASAPSSSLPTDQAGLEAMAGSPAPVAAPVAGAPAASQPPALLSGGSVPPPPPAAPPPTATPPGPPLRRLRPSPVPNYGRVPLRFEVNRGQAAPQVQFLSRDRGYNLFLTATETVLALTHPSAPQGRQRPVLRLQLVGANPLAPVTGLNQLPTRSNYYLGRDPRRWVTGVPNYARVHYQGVYPGIDLVYYGANRREVEYDFVVAPGASPGVIRLAVPGAQAMALDAQGNLALTVGGGRLLHRAPALYQLVGSQRQPVAGRYVLHPGNQVGFQVGAYDVSRPLYIDPVLSFSSFFGGSDVDGGAAIAVDGAGNTYVTGWTASADLPSPLVGQYAGGFDAFVTKLDPTGTMPLYTTYLGGDNDENVAFLEEEVTGGDIAVDASGNAYVTGFTAPPTDPMKGFPVLYPLPQSTPGGLDAGLDAFVVKLDPMGAIAYSTLLAGGDDDLGHSIALGSPGRVYVTGRTFSGDFPIERAFQEDPAGSGDAFVAGLDLTQTGSGALVYASYLGGSEIDGGFGIAVDGAGTAYLTGYTESDDLPHSGLFQPGYGGNGDAFVARVLPPSGTDPAALDWFTYLGDAGPDRGYGIALDAGLPYVTGTNGGDAFVAVLGPTGEDLLSYTPLAGADEDVGRDIAVDSLGVAYVTGWTFGDFPVTFAEPPFTERGAPEAFVAMVNPFPASGEDPLLFAVYLGGSYADYGRGIAVDANGDVYVTGVTESSDFLVPDPPEVFQTPGDAFVTKLSPSPGLTVRVEAEQPYAAEAGPTAGRFRVTRTGPTAAALTVYFQVSGSATPGTDYTALGSSVTIPASAQSEIVTVTPVPDSEPEADETVVLTLILDPVTPGNYALGAPGSARVSIADSKPLPPDFVPWSFAGPAGGERELVATAAGAAGADSAGAVPGAYSPAGVRYADGTVRLGMDELGSFGFGTDWGHTRVWTNGPGYDALSANGVGVVASQLPRLRQAGAGAVALVSSGSIARYFDFLSLTTYQARHFLRDRLSYDASLQLFTLTDSTGSRFRFHDFNLFLPPNQRGQLISVRDPFGNLTVVSRRTLDGKPKEVERTHGTGGQAVTESYVYSYYGESPSEPAGTASDGLLRRVELRRRVGFGGWATVRQVDYTYYGAGDPHGNVGDLKTATLKDGALPTLNVLDAGHYRYHTSDTATTYKHGLKMAFGYRSFARLQAAYPNFESATDAQAAPYADHYLQEYDGQRRVTKLTVQGLGGSTGTDGGRGTFTYEYLTSGHPGVPNNWKFRAVERQLGPGGAPLFVHTVYSNAAGRPLLKVFEAGGLTWREYFQYDPAGRLMLHAMPSAVNGHNEAAADLAVTLTGSGGNGLIERTTYHPGGAGAGYFHELSLRRGPGGTPVKQRTTNYTTRTADGITVVVPSAETVYRTDGAADPGLTTSYAYTWFPDTTRVESLTVTWPIVSAAQNGPGDADQQTTFFDRYGRPVWRRDADRFLHRTAYDVATGAVTQTIADANTDLTSDEPQGWMSPNGVRLHLVTQMQVDNLGRTTKLTSPEGRLTYVVYRDPQHEVRTYPGWVAAPGPTDPPRTTGPTTLTRYVDVAAGAGNGVTYTETLTMTAAPSWVQDNPSDVTTRRPTGAEMVGGLQSLGRTYVSSGGQVVRADRYFNLSGFAYGNAPYLGVPEVNGAGNYYTTAFDYDARGRQDRVQTHTGTVTRTDYDVLSRVTSVRVGTSDANLTQLNLNEYDHNSVGDSNLTRSFEYPAGGGQGQPERRMDYFYDWRNRLVGSKAGALVMGPEDPDTQRVLLYNEYDNLNRVIVSEQYDGDNQTILFTDGVAQPPQVSARRARTVTSFDDQGRVFRTQVYNVNQNTGQIVQHPSGPLSFDSVLTTDSWYNRRGLLIKSAPPGGLVTKVQYDGVGRTVVTYQTDGRLDTTWAHAGSVADDNALSQTETQYDKDGNVTFVIARERFHNETGVGPLGTPTAAPLARLSYAAYYHDAADRVLHAVEHGTNGGTVLTARPLALPAPTDPALVTAYGYAADEVQRVTADNTTGTFTLTFGSETTLPISGGASASDVKTRLQDDLAAILPGDVHVAGPNGGPWLVRFVGQYAGKDVAEMTATGDGLVAGVRTESQGGDAGRVQAVTNPRGFTSRTDADALGRALRTVEVYSDFVPSSSDDRTVEFTYDGSDHVRTRTHWLPGWARQTTEYVYGVSKGTLPPDSDLFSNELLALVKYPDKTSGLPSSAATEQQRYAYNALAQTKRMQDRNGTVHEYEFDVIGRPTVDQVTALGSGPGWAVDGAVQRLETAYDSASRPSRFRSYAQPTGGALVNEVQRNYNGFSQLTSEVQTVTLSAPRVVQYAYSETPLNSAGTGVRNHSRPTALIYPNARPLDYRYGSGLNDSISRLEDLAEGGTAREALTYLGLGTVVERAHEPLAFNHRQTALAQPGDGLSDSLDAYRGLDRFDRVAEQRWRTGNTDTDRFGYGHDRNSNRLYRQNLLDATFSELYHASGGYDPFDQLTAFTRGQLNPGRNGIEGTPRRSQTWALDGLGNWDTVTTTPQGGPPTPQARTHNRQNQLTAIDGAALGYDNSGNTTQGEAGKGYGYDAWNRLVRVTAGGLTVRYTFDALGRRVWESKTVGPTTTTREFYYSDGWQILEERDGSTGAVQAQNVWSPVYVDALVLREQGGQRYYVQQDANFNVTAITDASGTVLERYVYDPYGAVTVLNADWQVSPSLSTWVYLHQGGRYDGETGLYDFRNRYYEPKLGRWLNLDPIGYSAGDSVLYGYLGNGPTSALDPSGLSNAGKHHPYPLMLGGIDATQPRFDFTDEQHTAAERVLERYSVRNYNNTKKNDAARARWAAMSTEQQRAIIIESLQAAGVADSLIQSNIDDVMKGAQPGKNNSGLHRATPNQCTGRVISQAEIQAAAKQAAASQAAAKLSSGSQTGAPQTGGGGRMVARGLAVLNVYLTFRDALIASGVVKPELVEITAPYYFVDTDNSVFVVEVPGSWNFWSDRKKKFIAGARAGESVVITKKDVEKYQALAESRYGRYIPGGWFRDARFIPGTHRKTLPLVDHDTNADIGYIDEKGEHYYRRPGPARY